jgi:hypothetical protein
MTRRWCIQQLQMDVHIYTGERVGGAAAHNAPRRIDDLPSASRLRWRAARAEKAAHTQDNEVTDAVFHAPMFALNSDAE